MPSFRAVLSRAAQFSALVLLTTMACKEVLGPEDSAVAIEVVSGDNQAGRVSAVLSEDVVIRVTDRRGLGVNKANVLFRPDSGSGTVDPVVAITDSTGIASVSWRLGATLGPKSMTVSFADVAPVTVTATTVADRISIETGDQQSARVLGTLRNQLIVKVTDFLGEAVQGVPVTFTSATGSGTTSPAVIASDANGLARTTWTLGPASGAMSVSASIATAVVPVQFAAVANQDIMAVASGDAQGARATTTLPRPVQVRVTDQNGVLIPNVIVTFTPDAGSGSVNPVSAQTNALGIATTNWTLGATVGAQRLVARSSFSTPINVNAQGLAPSDLRIVSGNLQLARVGTAVASPLVVEVTDGSGARVPGAIVNFVPNTSNGTVSAGTAITDTLGRAQALWTLGSTVGPMSLRAISGNDTVTFNATTGADRISVTAGTGQSARFGTALADPISVVVRDINGATVPGVPVTFAPATGNGTVSPTTVSTDASGVARTIWTLGGTPGSMRLTVSAPTAVQSVDVTANASGDVLSVVSGGTQFAQSGAALPSPVVVQLLGPDGLPVSGATVTFTPDPANGTVSAASVTTSATGRAQTNWTLGAAAGTMTMRVATATALPINMSATARAAATAAVTAGDNQSARFGTALPTPIAVTVRDLNGDPVPGLTVTFTPASGNGSVSPATAATSAAGVASTVWTLGAAPSAMTLTVSAPGVANLTVSATATGDSLRVIAGDAQRALVGTALPTPVRVELKSGSAVVPNVLVTFTPASGSGTVPIDTVRTDAFGVAQTTWTLGAARGPLTMRVSTPVSASRTVTATALAASSVSLVTAGSLSGYVGTPLDSTLRVRVSDSGGDVVPGVTVSFAPSAGSVSAATGTTNASGEASVRWTLGNTPGAQTLTAAVGASPSVVVNATARVDSSRVLTIVSGNSQDTTLTTALGAALVVRVADRFGNVVQGATINWSGNNGVTFASSSSTTNASGDASATPTTGTTLGASSVTATVAGRTESVTFGVTTQGRLTSVWAGNMFSCGLAERGEAYCWGFNQNKQLGSSDTASYTNAPTIPLMAGSVIPTFRKMDGGENHGCGITVARQLMCWGLGQGSFGTATPTTINIAGMTVMEDVAVGSGHTCALSASGMLVCSGDNARGQLGTNSIAANTSPYLVVDSLYSSVAAGGLHSCGFVRGSGRLMCWGDNQKGQVGDGTTASRQLAPTPVVGGVTWDTTSLVLGEEHACALNSAGAAICWGSNSFGQLGTGTTGGFSSDTALASGGLVFVKLVAGRDHTCGITAGSVAHCWGRNDAGQLGDGTRTSRNVPTAVTGGLQFSGLAAGELHSCGVATNATGSQTLARPDLVFCWGDSEYGQAGTGSFRGNSTPLLTPTRVSNQP